PTPACCSTCGPSGSSPRTRRAATSSSSWCASTRPGRRRAPKELAARADSCKGMSLVPSLLQAIVHVDGEALVMHAAGQPHAVSPTGQVDLATRGLALDAVNGIVNQLLPPEQQRALDEFGAVQHELAPIAEFPGEHFTIVAARGGDDLWVEIRRRRIPDEDRIPDEFFPSPEVAATAQPYPVYASAGSPSPSPPTQPPPPPPPP